MCTVTLLLPSWIGVGWVDTAPGADIKEVRLLNPRHSRLEGPERSQSHRTLVCHEWVWSIERLPPVRPNKSSFKCCSEAHRIGMLKKIWSANKLACSY